MIQTKESSYRGIVQWAGIPGFHQLLFDMIVKEVSPGARILDCGAGPGALALRLKDAGFAVEAIEQDRSVYQVEDVPCHYLDLNSPFAEAIPSHFDAITAIEIIEHLENPRHFLRQCYRLLVPDGIVLLTTPSVESVPARLRFLVTGNFRSFDSNETVSEPTHITPIQSYLFEKAAESSGFEVLQHFVFPEGTLTNTRVLSKVLSWILIPFVGGHSFGCNHVYQLKRLQR